MALAEMQKVHMAMHRAVGASVMVKIQELGCCHFVKHVSDQETAPVNLSGGALEAVELELRKVDDLLSEVRFVSRFVEPHATEKPSALASMMGDVPEYSIESLAAACSEPEFRALASLLRGLEKKFSDTHSQIARMKSLAAQLEGFVNLPFPLELLNAGTGRTRAGLFNVKVDSVSSLTEKLLSETEQCVEFSPLIPAAKNNEGVLAVVYLKEHSDLVLSILQDSLATRVDVPEQLVSTCAEELKLAIEEIRRLESEAELILADIRQHANQAYKQSMLMSDYWSMRRSQLEALLEGDDTQQAVLLQFWIPKQAIAVLKKHLEAFSDSYEMLISDPSEDDVVPTLLQNAKWAEPIETFTLMYGTPAYGGVDPTPLMTPFFYLFFGMCFGDAGYGLLLGGILLYFLMKKQMAPTARKLFIILAMGAGASVLFGIITSSWFGDSIDAFSFLAFMKPLKAFQLLDPGTNPIPLLGISLLLGIIQIYVGIGVAMYDAFRKGDYMAAFADQGGWIVLLSGLIGMLVANGDVLPETLYTPMKLMAMAGALILVATQGRSKKGIVGKLFSGVLSLYNVTGYMGDILSYSRLLALGLGSATVGMVINLLANLVSEGSSVGVVFGVIVFVVGHIFSIAVNILGAFVHSLRLQYVEFLGKFLDASGTDFIPLAQRPKHIRIVNEKA